MGVYLTELRIWVALAFPTAFRELSDLIPWLVSLAMVGHVSTTALAALSLTETWLYGFSVIVWGTFAMAGSNVVRSGAVRAA